jgi:DNA-binding LacI/PurR family transcriptional regulator
VATARDVAERANVSTSTVSHVMNGTRVVSDELRARVLAAAQELGYEANAVARSLKTRRSHTIALITPDIGNPFFTAVERGVEDVTTAHGYSLILCNSAEDPRREERYLRMLGAQRVDGLILASAGERYPYLDRVLQAKTAVVLLDRVLPGLPAPAVTLDNVDAARIATRHLVSLGHRRIGMVAPRHALSSATERIAGYRMELEVSGIPYDPELIADGRSLLEEARVAAGALLDLPERPTALIVGNNLMTLGAVAAIEARGLRIPEDIAIVGFDDAIWADVLHPRLTTIAQPTYELGRTAADLLLRRIETPDSLVPLRTAMSGRLLVRESCGAALAAPGHA